MKYKNFKTVVISPTPGSVELKSETQSPTKKSKTKKAVKKFPHNHKLEAYVDSVGGVSSVAKKLGVNRKSLSRWINGYEETPKMLEQIMYMADKNAALIIENINLKEIQ